jgi:FMN phosphatase YigB (HAD superfamily)
LKSHGAKLYILSMSMSDAESAAKRKFTAQNFAGMFEDVRIVASDAEKLPVIREIAEKAGVRPEECELIEDTYATVLAAIVAGMKGTHVSHIYCNLT